MSTNQAVHQTRHKDAEQVTFTLYLKNNNFKEGIVRGISLMDWVWEIKLEYKNYPDSSLQISSLDAPDIFSALARTYRHVRECWPYEIISIKQKIQPVAPVERREVSASRAGRTKGINKVKSSSGAAN